MHDDSLQPMYFRPYVPGKIVISIRWFVCLCLLAFLGSLTLLFMIFA